MTHTTIWAERLAASDGIDIRPVPEGRQGMTPGKSMLYPSARMVYDAIRELPEGQTITPKELRASLADRHDAEYTCPVTTTMMLRVVAEAANETRQNGAARADIAPVWRVLDARASALRRLTFDPAWILEERARESRSIPDQ
jgi:hypothetical protein